jgi:hypothetical protein
MADFDNDFEPVGCDCPACRPELYPAEPMDEPFSVPEDDTYNKELSDEDFEAVVLGGFDAPQDIDAVFARIFGEEKSEEELHKEFPYDVGFTLDEIRTISASLRVRGTALAVDSLKLIDDESFWEKVSVTQEASLNAILAKAAEESAKCLELYDWFDDRFDVRE